MVCGPARRCPRWLPSRTSGTRSSSGGTEMLAIPGDRPLETLVEPERRLPAKLASGLAGVEILLGNFAGGLVEHHWGERSAHELRDPRDHLQDGQARFVR